MTAKLRWRVLATHVPAGAQGGGIVRYTVELIQALARRDDVVVDVIATRSAQASVAALLDGKGRVVVVPDAPIAMRTFAERHRLAPDASDGVDVVHGMKHVLPRASKALRVLTVHDLLLLDRPRDFSAAKRLLLPPVYRASLRDADVLLCVSEATRRRLVSVMPAMAEHSVTVPLATPYRLLSATSTPVPALANRRFALAVGDDSPRKNLRTVIDAWSLIRGRAPDAILAIAGSAARALAGGDAVRALQGEGALALLGRVGDGELRWAYENATVTLCPSLAEGFGLSAAEALDFGCALVISDDPALREAAAGEARAVIAALDTCGWVDAVVEAMASPPRRALPPSPRRTWDDVADDTVSSVRRALGSR